MTRPHNVWARRLLRPRRNVSDSFDITYAAHTATCTFLLDSEGICRRIVVAPNSKREARSAARCVGAQYVASLDPNVSGMLAEMPRIGAAMLFACIDERKRVTLVRTGLVTRFERHAEDPFVETEKAPSMSVQTSAPEIAPSAPAPRKSRPPPAPSPDVYEEEANDRTQPIQALRPAVLRSLRPSPNPSPSPAVPLGDDDATLERTSEYQSRPGPRSSSASGSAPRATWPSPGAIPTPPPVPTLRQPPAFLPQASEDEPRAAHARGVLPRRSEPYVVRTRADRPAVPVDPARTPRAAGYPPVEKVASGRARGDR